MSGKDKDSHFGHALRSALSDKSMMQSDLANLLSVSSAYVSSISTGSKKVSAQRVDAITKVLSLDDRDAVKLHRAAARDLGFNLDLPDDF